MSRSPVGGNLYSFYQIASMSQQRSASTFRPPADSSKPKNRNRNSGASKPIPLVPPIDSSSANQVSRKVSKEETPDVDAPRRGSPHLPPEAPLMTPDEPLGGNPSQVRVQNRELVESSSKWMLSPFPQIYLRHLPSLRSVDRDPENRTKPLESAAYDVYTPLRRASAHLCPEPLLPFSPLIHRDPLFEYGALNGKLPGRSQEETIKVRDILLRWTSMHKETIWDDLPSESESLKNAEIFRSDIISFHTPDDWPYFSLIPLKLLEVGHLVLTLSQIIKELVEVLYHSDYNAPSVDPGFAVVRTLGMSEQPDGIILVLKILKNRCGKAHKKILQFFNELKVMFLDPADTLQSLSARNDVLETLPEGARVLRQTLLEDEEERGQNHNPSPYVHRHRIQGKHPSDEVKARREAYYLSMNPLPSLPL
ncbi:hypothetical protein CVT26_014515 [Gymnopilus dilepis]|uniref:Uncharacterized protein n=1 Tax=Gymnopilus dilepis TaxID=231916 RepID=A0A409W364_9AGAR|nr:hypothetical protein CVT26_014515 [Gymnopilus dilepis]